MGYDEVSAAPAVDGLAGDRGFLLSKAALASSGMEYKSGILSKAAGCTGRIVIVGLIVRLVLVV